LLVCAYPYAGQKGRRAIGKRPKTKEISQKDFISFWRGGIFKKNLRRKLKW